MNERTLAVGNVYVYGSYGMEYADVITGYDAKLDRWHFVRISMAHGGAWRGESRTDSYEGIRTEVHLVDKKYFNKFIKYLFETQSYMWESE